MEERTMPSQTEGQRNLQQFHGMAANRSQFPSSGLYGDFQAQPPGLGTVQTSPRRPNSSIGSRRETPSTRLAAAMKARKSTHLTPAAPARPTSAAPSSARSFDRQPPIGGLTEEPRFNRSRVSSQQGTQQAPFNSNIQGSIGWPTSPPPRSESARPFDRTARSKGGGGVNPLRSSSRAPTAVTPTASRPGYFRINLPR